MKFFTAFGTDKRKTANLWFGKKKKFGIEPCQEPEMKKKKVFQSPTRIPARIATGEESKSHFLPFIFSAIWNLDRSGCPLQIFLFIFTDIYIYVQVIWHPTVGCGGFLFWVLSTEHRSRRVILYVVYKTLRIN